MQTQYYYLGGTGTRDPNARMVIDMARQDWMENGGYYVGWRQAVAKQSERDGTDNMRLVTQRDHDQ